MLLSTHFYLNIRINGHHPSYAREANGIANVLVTDLSFRTTANIQVLAYNQTLYTDHVTCSARCVL